MDDKVRIHPTSPIAIGEILKKTLLQGSDGSTSLLSFPDRGKGRGNQENPEKPTLQEDLLKGVWIALSEIYGGANLSRVHSDMMPYMWRRGLKDVSRDALWHGVDICVDDKSGFPPTLGQFKDRCRLFFKTPKGRAVLEERRKQWEIACDAKQQDLLKIDHHQPPTKSIYMATMNAETALRERQKKALKAIEKKRNSPVMDAATWNAVLVAKKKAAKAALMGDG